MQEHAKSDTDDFDLAIFLIDIPRVPIMMSEGAICHKEKEDKIGAISHSKNLYATTMVMLNYTFLFSRVDWQDLKKIAENVFAKGIDTFFSKKDAAFYLIRFSWLSTIYHLSFDPENGVHDPLSSDTLSRILHLTIYSNYNFF